MGSTTLLSKFRWRKICEKEHLWLDNNQSCKIITLCMVYPFYCSGTYFQPLSGSAFIRRKLLQRIEYKQLALNVTIATKAVCLSRLLKCLRSLYGKQCGPRSDCSYNVRQLFAADNFSRQHFQMHFFLPALTVSTINTTNIFRNLNVS